MFRKIQLSCFCNWPRSCHMKCQTIDISRDKPLHCLVNKLSFGIGVCRQFDRGPVVKFHRSQESRILCKLCDYISKKKLG